MAKTKWQADQRRRTIEVLLPEDVFRGVEAKAIDDQSTAREALIALLRQAIAGPHAEERLAKGEAPCSQS